VVGRSNSVATSVNKARASARLYAQQRSPLISTRLTIIMIFDTTVESVGLQTTAYGDVLILFQSSPRHLTTPDSAVDPAFECLDLPQLPCRNPTSISSSPTFFPSSIRILFATVILVHTFSNQVFQS
jgi:hypothetical protein